MNIFAIFLIKLYRLFISPLSHGCCRYAPTCSDYAIESLQKHGLLKGGIMSLKRIVSCNPFGGNGYDPVPQKNVMTSNLNTTSEE